MGDEDVSVRRLPRREKRSSQKQWSDSRPSIRSGLAECCAIAIPLGRGGEDVHRDPPER